MSGKRNKKPSDVVKARQEYLDNLSLEVQLNDANEQAVKQFKETGQVPPISQMKDTRSPSQILADTEKLKISLIKDLEPIADPQFAQQIVSRLIQSPLNADNRLLIFTAQRIDDIVKNLSKIYKYGIKGDANDAEQFVGFINKFYTDKNNLILGTKSYMNRLGSSELSGSSGNKITEQHDLLVSLLAEFNSLHIKFIKGQLVPIVSLNPLRSIKSLTSSIRNKFTALINIVPRSSIVFKTIEQLLISEEGTSQYYPLLNNYERWLYFINHNIPNLNYAKTLLDDLVKYLHTNIYDANRITDILQKLDDVLDIDMLELKELEPISNELMKLVQKREYMPQTFTQTPHEETGDKFLDIKRRVNTLINNISRYRDISSYVRKFKPTIESNNVRDYQMLKDIHNELSTYFDKIQAEQGEAKEEEPDLEFHDAVGFGFKTKHRMNGKGLPSVDYTRGIDPSPRYIKFGRYMINNKKLNDNILSLRRQKGSSIATIPATKMTSNLGSIIKKIVGGSVPSYDELNKLTDEEKRYLYKVSQEADIYDKIKIPTPSKDEEEKDIHAFNVMKGEILAGNNSKELISKFKTLLNKLTRQNILPKSQVHEILETLLELNL